MGPLRALGVIVERDNRMPYRVMQVGAARSGGGEMRGRGDKLGKLPGERLSDLSPEGVREGSPSIGGRVCRGVEL